MKKEEEIILTKALEKFMRNGFHRTTMDEIASELRISKKTIYKYFPSKEKLVHSAIAHLQKFIKENFNEILINSDNAVLKIFRIFEFLGRFLSKTDERALEDFKIHIPEIWEGIDKFRTKVIADTLTVVIEQGKSEGLILNYPTPVIMTIYNSSIRGILNPDFLMNHKFSLEEAKNLTIDIMMNAILTKQGKEIYNKSKAGK